MTVAGTWPEVWPNANGLWECPKCQNTEYYDNRGQKTNPRQPDLKCRNRECDYAIFPRRSAQPPARAQHQSAPNGAQPVQQSAPTAEAVETPEQVAVRAMKIYVAAYERMGKRIVDFETAHEYIPKVTSADLCSAAATVTIAALGRRR